MVMVLVKHDSVKCENANDNDSNSSLLTYAGEWGASFITFVGHAGCRGGNDDPGALS